MDAQELKQRVDAYTEQYITQRIRGLDEELTDLATELALYLAKPELDDYEKARKEFIEKLFAWKEKIWEVEGEIEDEIDEMTEEELLNFERNLKQIVTERYEQELGELFEQVKSLQV